MQPGSLDGEVTSVGESLSAWKLAVQVDSLTKLSLQNEQNTCSNIFEAPPPNCLNLTFWKTKPHSREFPGGPVVVRALHSHC